MLGDRRGGPGLHVGGRAELQRPPLGPDISRQSADPLTPAGDVVDDPYAVSEPVRPAPLQRLPDRGEPEALAGVDGEVEVLPLQILECVQMTGGRVTRLSAGDIEADYSHIA